MSVSIYHKGMIREMRQQITDLQRALENAQEYMEGVSDSVDYYNQQINELAASNLSLIKEVQHLRTLLEQSAPDTNKPT